MLNVDSHGNVSSFSPELLGLRNAAYADYLLGNIHTHSLAQIHEACLRSALFRDIQQGVEACAQSCEYFSVCGGGAPVNKLFETGSFTGTRTSYCTLTQMVPTDLHPGGIRPARAKLDSATGPRGRCSITEAAMTRSTLLATVSATALSIVATLALATAYAQTPPAGGPPPQGAQQGGPGGPQGGPPPNGQQYGDQQQPANSANEPHPPGRSCSSPASTSCARRTMGGTSSSPTAW